MRYLHVCSVISLAFLLTSCGDGDTQSGDAHSGDTHQKVADDAVVLMNEMAIAIEGIKDDASFDAAMKTMEEISTRMSAVVERGLKLGEPSAEDKKMIDN